MKNATCALEGRVLATARGTSAPDGEIALHLNECAHCRDLALAASATADDSRRAIQSAPVPGSGLVWWRIQQRAQREAMQAAARAVTVIQAVTVAAGIVFAMAIVGARIPLENLARLFDGFSVSLTGAAHALPSNLVTVFAAGAFLTLVPIALYLALARE